MYVPEDTAWDEDISLALQEVEMQEFVDGNLAPIPEDLPLPFGNLGIPKVTDEVLPTNDENNSDLNAGGIDAPDKDQTPVVDWWDKILDRRGLRGRPVPPLPLSVPGRDPSELATPKGKPPKPSASSSSSSSVGIIQRGSKLRSGVDRWHNPDGSIRYRLREQQAAEAAARETATLGPTTTADDGEDGMSCADPTMAPVSFYSSSAPLLVKGTDDSTTASDMGVMLAPDASSDSSSASSSQVSVGFWKNGVWYSRPRTPAEERSHRGGGGPRRTQRKQDRVQAYFSGTWKPAWLQHYIDDRKSREDAAQEADTVKEETQIPVEPQQATAEPTSHTDVDPWSGQWQSTSQWWTGTWSSTSWWDSWGWSTSSTTSPPANLHALPDPGLP